MDKEIPLDHRPDKVGFCVVGNDESIIRIVADVDGPVDDGALRFTQDYYREKNHVIVEAKDRMAFLCGHDRDKPAKIVVDWIL